VRCARAGREGQKKGDSHVDSKKKESPLELQMFQLKCRMEEKGGSRNYKKKELGKVLRRGETGRLLSVGIVFPKSKRGGGLRGEITIKSRRDLLFLRNAEPILDTNFKGIN